MDKEALAPSKPFNFCEMAVNQLDLASDFRESAVPFTELMQFLKHPEPENYECKQKPILDNQPDDPILPIHEVGRYGNREDKWPCFTEKTIIELWQSHFGADKSFPGFFRATTKTKLAFSLIGSKTKPLRVAILTAGGLAPGLNTVIHQIIRRHELYCKYALDRPGGSRPIHIYGIPRGFHGLAEIEKERLPFLASSSVGDRKDLHGKIRGEFLYTGAFKNLGGSLLGCSRGKESDEQMEKCAHKLRSLEIDILYCIGGEGTASAAYKLSQLIGGQSRRPTICVVPKTIDNDILWAEFSFGLRTAVDSAVEAIHIMNTEAEATGRVAVIELMGKESGFIAANASLASGVCDLCLIPELHRGTIDASDVANYIKDRFEKRVASTLLPFAVIVTAEGYSKAFRGPIPGLDPAKASGSTFVDALNVALEGSEIEAVFHKPGYVIRAADPSPTDRILCRRLARSAVDNALAGFDEFAIIPSQTGDALVPLRLIAKRDAGGLGGQKMINIDGRFWAEVSSRNEQNVLDGLARERRKEMTNSAGSALVEPRTSEKAR